MSRSIAIGDGTGPAMPGYIAEPEARPTSAVIVVQEAFGLNADVRRRCDRIAEAGRLALAPDLYWRFGDSIELDPDIEPQRRDGLGLLARLDEGQAVHDLQMSVDYARSVLPAAARVGAVGFCIGGKLAYLAAARTTIDAAVGYYGVGIEDHLAEKDAAAPFMLHVGEDDQYFTRAAQERIAVAFGDSETLFIHRYAHSAHGFASEFGQRRVPEAASLADERSAAFFRRWLDGS